jgi:subtilisin family serine protease
MAQRTASRLERGPEEISREHVDYFLARRRRQEEDLTHELGRVVISKLHPWIIGDLLTERAETAFADALGADRPAPVRVAVMVNMTTGRQEHPRRARTNREDRTEVVRELQRSAEFALARLKDDLGARGTELTGENWLTHSATASLMLSDLEHVAARGDVASISSEKRQFIANLDTSRPLIRADQVQAAGNTGAGIVVAIQDTGIDNTHPALQGVVNGAQQDMTGTAVAGMPDGFGHGTHCAGIVASQDAVFRGIAPGARLIDIRLMDATGSAQPSWCTAAFAAAVASGANVSSNSWGFTHADGAWVDANGTCVLCTAANNAVAAGVVVVVAGGNEDNDSCSTYDTHLGCPAIAENVITVAASDDADHMAGFSSLGPTPDGRAKPDITAPGVDIASCQAAGTALGSVVAPGFIHLSGTSMATPHVAGVAALILSRNRRQTPANVKSLVMSTAVNIGATANEMGAGRVDALAAVNATPTP